jgi:ferritin
MSLTPVILQTADGSDHKSINNFMLFDRVARVAINRVSQPSTNDVLEKLIEVINHTFDFQKKVSVNVELGADAIERDTNGHDGIVIGIPQSLC